MFYFGIEYGLIIELLVELRYWFFYDILDKMFRFLSFLQKITCVLIYRRQFGRDDDFEAVTDVGFNGTKAES